jgi:hypothetical protein
MNDKNSPYSYKEWLALQSGNLSLDVQLLYSDYLRNWYKTNLQLPLEQSNITKQEYLQLVKDISYLFDKDEKDRFLKNINYENPEELIFAIPYFVKKLKEIAKVLNAKRTSVKKAKLKYNLNGSVNGLNNLLYEYILKSFTKTENSITQIPASEISGSFPELSAVKDNFFIEIEELYDTNVYYDSDPTVDIQKYTNVEDFLNNFPFEGLSEEEIFGILQTRFIPRVADTPLSNVYRKYLEFLNENNGEDFDIDETVDSLSLQNQNQLVPLQVAATQKYLGETVYGLTATRLKDLDLPDQTIILNFEQGNNWFLWPSGNQVLNLDVTDNFLRPIALNESNLRNSGATGGESLRDSDLIFTDRNGIVEGAWLRGFRTITAKSTASIRISPNSVREFIFPYVGFNVTTKGLNWIGHTLNDDTFQNFQILPTAQKKELLENYYTRTLPPSSSSPVYLNQTTLISQGSLAGEFYNDSDVVIKQKFDNTIKKVYSDQIRD